MVTPKCFFKAINKQLKKPIMCIEQSLPDAYIFNELMLRT